MDDKSAKTLKKHIRHAARAAVAALALYFTLRGEDLASIGRALWSLDRWVLAVAVIVALASQILVASRWNLLLRAQSIMIGWSVAVRLHFVGLFYNSCLPGATGGDLIKAWYAIRHTTRRLAAALSVFVDRAVGVVGLVILAGLCLVMLDGQQRQMLFEFGSGSGQKSRDISAWIVYCIPVAAGLVTGVLAVSRRGRDLLRRTAAFVRHAVVRVAAEIRDSVRVYMQRKSAVVYALGLTFAGQGAFVLALLLLGRSLGMQCSAKYYFIFFPISWMLGAIPVSIGGIGVMEGWLKLAFSQVPGVTAEQALILALCQRLLLLLGSVPGALVHLFWLPDGGQKPAERTLDLSDQ